MMSKFLVGGEKTPSPSPNRENPDLHSSLRFLWFQDNLYTMFIIVDIKCAANIKWSLCQNTVKFQNITSLLDKFCTNIQTSTGYYLLNWVLASLCSCSQKSWVLLFTVSRCRAVVHSFQNLIWTAMTLLFTSISFFACVHGMYDSIWCYLNWTVV